MNGRTDARSASNGIAWRIGAESSAGEGHGYLLLSNSVPSTVPAAAPVAGIPE